MGLHPDPNPNPNPNPHPHPHQVLVNTNGKETITKEDVEVRDSLF